MKTQNHGIRFECQGSGKCCMSRGTYGYVYFSLPDRRRMAKVLGISTTEFTKNYCTTTNGLYHLKHPEKDCVFLEEKRCKAYEGRPTQCRTWPFWPENMNAKTWNTEIAPFCPGVGKGKLYSLGEIEKILQEARLGDPSEPDVKT